MKKGSKAAKAWGAKMRRLRGTKKKTKRKSTTRKRKRSTRKGQVRKTARRAYTGLKKTKRGRWIRAYTGLKRRVSRRKKSDSAWNF